MRPALIILKYGQLFLTGDCFQSTLKNLQFTELKGIRGISFTSYTNYMLAVIFHSVPCTIVDLSNQRKSHRCRRLYPKRGQNSPLCESKDFINLCTLYFGIERKKWIVHIMSLHLLLSHQFISDRRKSLRSRQLYSRRVEIIPEFDSLTLYFGGETIIEAKTRNARISRQVVRCFFPGRE